MRAARSYGTRSQIDTAPRRAGSLASREVSGLSLVELEEEMCEAESRSPSRCGGDGVYSQEGKIQKVRGAGGGASPAWW